MDSSQFLGITTFTYLFASFLYIAALLFRSRMVGVVATWFTAAALLVQTVGLGLRWIESYQMGIGHAPLTNMYESVIFFAWTIVIFYLGIDADRVIVDQKCEGDDQKAKQDSVTQKAGNLLTSQYPDVPYPQHG